MPPVGMSLTWWIGLAWMRAVTTPHEVGGFEGFGLDQDLLSISFVGCVDDAVVSEVQENRRRVESTGIRGTRLVVPCVMVCLDDIHFLTRDCEPYLFWGHHAKT